MESGAYICYGDDKEDLTPKVLAAKGAEGDYQVKSFDFGDITNRQKKHRWRVAVECSKGHKNIFEGED